MRLLCAMHKPVDAIALTMPVVAADGEQAR
jgi:hypothetical protein